ncbi:g6471 [Coccomyxa viridis]|uniref:G6471 protein n=1 Tax=Coccomyxa viridis TaxID=1274662 RepID=A0ABP1FY07_9CHLO
MVAAIQENGHNGHALDVRSRARNDVVVRKLIEIFPDIGKNEVVLKALLQDRKAAETPKKAKAAKFSFSVRAWARLKAFILLILLLYTIPVSWAIVMASIVADLAELLQRKDGSKQVWNRLMAGMGRRTGEVRGTAIVSGAKSTKGLHMCRHLHRAGWRVVLVDVKRNWAAGARWSGCVAAFRTYPEPNLDPLGYLEAIATIAAEERAKLFVPVSIAQYSVYEALAADLLARSFSTRACTLDARMTAELNDKSSFSALCEHLGVLVPKSSPITSKELLFQLNKDPEEFGDKRFLLKSIAYNATARSDMFTLPCSDEALREYVTDLDISEDQPWMLQQLLQGTEFSSYSVAHEGHLILHCDTVACASNLRYVDVGDRQILDWVKEFCTKTGASGQLCFDFMRDTNDGRMYAFECNPRTSTILLNFYNHDHVAQAFFNAKGVYEFGKAPYKPLSNAKQVIWIWNEVGELIFGELPKCKSLGQAWQSVKDRAQLLFSSVDALLDPADPLPFLALHYQQVVALLLRNIELGNPWVKVDLCTGKLVEIGGD